MPVTVYNISIDTVWKPFLDQTIIDWNNLDTPIFVQEVNYSEAEIEFVVKQGNGWLGLAQIWLGSRGHISKGRLSMSTKLLNVPEYTPEAVQHVFCQEMGHLLGLDHTIANSCMDDCSWARGEEWLACLNSPLSTRPDSHDEEQLNLIYNHEDFNTPQVNSPNEENNCELSAPGCGEGKWVTVHYFKDKNEF